MSHDKARIWFFTDFHGSDRCFRKFLNLVKHRNRPNVLILGGDITGKQLVPIVEDPHGNIRATFGYHEIRVPASELSKVKQKISDHGYYPYECADHVLKQLRTDGESLEAIFEKLVRERLQKWVKLADSRLPPHDVCQVLVSAGNDDPLFTDEILDTSARLIRPEGRVIDLPCDLKLISTGYCNETPWDCPRDVTELQLAQRIAKMTAHLKAGDTGRLLFNLHCPPKDTALDLADKIDRHTMRRVAGPKGPIQEHVGSTAVRNAIENWQPIASLHGHIHQVYAKDHIGKTICFNPGSDYRSGHLQGAFLQITKAGAIEFETLTQERDAIEPKKGTQVLDSLVYKIPVIGPAVRDHHLKHGLDELREESKDIKRILQELKTKSYLDSSAKTVEQKSGL